MKNNLVVFLKKIYKKVLGHKVISLVVIILLGYLFYHFFSTQTASSVTYQYANVKRGSLVSIVSGTGQVVSNSQVDLKPKVNANVTALYVKAGDNVKKGQVLFRLDATDAYKQVRDAKISLESAQISLEKLTNPTALSVMNIKNSIQVQKEAEESQNQKVATAYKTLLNSNLQIVPDGNYTIETAPSLSGSYIKNEEGKIKLSVYQGGQTGYSFNASGVTSCTGDINMMVAQPICDTGLYIKWNGNIPQTNWIINIPNTQSSSYSSNYDTWQNAITNKDIANSASERSIASLNQQLADLSPSDNNVDVRSAKLTLEQRQNALNDAEQNLSYYTVTAPFDGIMANLSVDVGSSAVMASANSSAPLGTIVTDKKLAQVILNETDIIKIKLGQKAKITFDAINGLSLDGDVVEINTLGTVTSGVVTYKAKIAFATDDVRILPNMSVSVDMITNSKDNVLFVPNQAVKNDVNGYYVEEDSSIIISSSTKKFNNASSSVNYNLASSTATGTHYRNINASSGRQRNGVATTSIDIVLKRVSISIGMQTDTQTEIISGLIDGEKVITKKTTVTASTNTTAPSITSLFRAQGNRTGVNARP